MDQVFKGPAVPIRVPATANLMIDSFDRTTGDNCWDFYINNRQNILNGFFQRIGTTEVVLQWFENNISQELTNNEITITYPSGGGGTQYVITIPDGIYTIAGLLDEIVANLNAATAPNSWEIVQDTVGARLKRVDNAAFDLDLNPSGNQALLGQLGIAAQVGAAKTFILVSWSGASIQEYRYLDFVCSQLTYNQDLKDSSTQPAAGDVLCRWYMAYDQPTATDAYGFPILMGYEPFTLRRLFNPPKQIMWDNIQPIGNLRFEVFGGNWAGDYERLDKAYPQTENTNWLMTLQVSEN